MSNHDGVILVVDDELDVLDTVRMSLTEWGYHTDTFSDPRTGLDAFRESPTRYSLILTDFRMPGMTGVELAKQAQKIKGDVRVLIMTAFEMDNEILGELPTISKNEILRKPIRLEQLCKAVKKQSTVNKRSKQ